MRRWFGRLARIESKIDLLLERQQRIMSALDNLQANEAALEPKIDALLAFAAAQRDLAVQLKAQLDAMGNTDPVLEDLARKLGAENDKIATFLAADNTPHTT